MSGRLTEAELAERIRKILATADEVRRERSEARVERERPLRADPVARQDDTAEQWGGA